MLVNLSMGICYISNIYYVSRKMFYGLSAGRDAISLCVNFHAEVFNPSCSYLCVIQMGLRRLFQMTFTFSQCHYRFTMW